MKYDLRKRVAYFMQDFLLQGNQIGLVTQVINVWGMSSSFPAPEI